MAFVIQLTFEPAYDAYHSMFRMLRLRETIRDIGALDIDVARILDFYLLFPFRLSAIRLKREDGRIRSIGRRYVKTRPYSEMPDDVVLLNRMKPIQYAALSTLAGKQLIDAGALEEEQVKPTDGSVSEALATRIGVVNQQDAELLSALATLATNYTLTGPDGLKARSGLMEHRYD
ncbi:hypothetical protein NF701_05045 [Sphingomonadaceae bacterium OTU29THOMA1]|nr:hypothetical protein NF701_05045 [Sphingomonadaceae bacterium OTU29THOMA1]